MRIERPIFHYFVESAAFDVFLDIVSGAVPLQTNLPYVPCMNLFGKA